MYNEREGFPNKKYESRLIICRYKKLFSPTIFIFSVSVSVSVSVYINITVLTFEKN